MVYVTYTEGMDALEQLDLTPEKKAEVQKILGLLLEGAGWKAVRNILADQEKFPNILKAIEVYSATTANDIYY